MPDLAPTTTASGSSKGEAPAGRVLVADDDLEIRELITRQLRAESLGVLGVCDIAAVRTSLSDWLPDVIVLDLNMPEGDGLALCRDLRSAGCEVSIIMVTARTSAVDRVLGLEFGADDYLAKPIEPRELLVRVRNLLRRRRTGSLLAPYNARTAAFRPWRLDVIQRRLTAPADSLVVLSGGEFRLLCRFLDQPRQVLSREALLPERSATVAFDRSIDIQVSRLRQNLGGEAGGERLVRVKLCDVRLSSVFGSLAARMVIVITLGMSAATTTALYIAEQARLEGLREAHTTEMLDRVSAVVEGLRGDAAATEGKLRAGALQGVHLAPAWPEGSPDLALGLQLADRVGQAAAPDVLVAPSNRCSSFAGTSEPVFRPCWYVRFHDPTAGPKALLIDVPLIKVYTNSLLDPVYLAIVFGISALLGPLISHFTAAPVRRLTRAAKDFSVSLDPALIPEQGRMKSGWLWRPST